MYVLSSCTTAPQIVTCRNAGSSAVLNRALVFLSSTTQQSRPSLPTSWLLLLFAIWHAIFSHAHCQAEKCTVVGCCSACELDDHCSCSGLPDLQCLAAHCMRKAPLTIVANTGRCLLLGVTVCFGRLVPTVSLTVVHRGVELGFCRAAGPCSVALTCLWWGFGKGLCCYPLCLLLLLCG